MRYVRLQLIAAGCQLIATATLGAQTPPTERDAPGPERRVERVIRRTAADSVMRNRATLGVTLGHTGSTRDTLGIFIGAVAENGPAERAGIYEGDRVAAINGVDVRTSATDAEDPYLAGVAGHRLSREMRRLTAGQTVSLRVWSGGRYKDVQVTSARYSDVYTGRSFSFGFGDGGMVIEGPDFERRIEIGPGGRRMLRAPMPPPPPVPPVPPTPPTPPTSMEFQLDLGPAIANALAAVQPIVEESMLHASEAVEEAMAAIGPTMLELSEMFDGEFEHQFDMLDHHLDMLDDLDVDMDFDLDFDGGVHEEEIITLAQEALRQGRETLAMIDGVASL